MKSFHEILSPSRKIIQMNAAELNWWEVNIGSGNGLVPSGNKLLSVPLLT